MATFNFHNEAMRRKPEQEPQNQTKKKQKVFIIVSRNNTSTFMVTGPTQITLQSMELGIYAAPKSV